jgi:hypothetical protein
VSPSFRKLNNSETEGRKKLKISENNRNLYDIFFHVLSLNTEIQF